MANEKNKLEMELHKLAEQYKDKPENLKKAIIELTKNTSLDATISFLKKKSESTNLILDTSDPTNVSHDLTPVETPSQNQIETPAPAQLTEEEAEIVNKQKKGGKRRKKTKKYGHVKQF
jgi:hypothetical protein